MEVYMIPNGPYNPMDNFIYYITTDKDTVPGIFVDVYDPEVAIEFLAKQGITMEPAAILTTHHHSDHSNGNPAMRQKFPNVQVIGGKEDKVKGATMDVVHEQVIEINGLRINC